MTDFHKPIGVVEDISNDAPAVGRDSKLRIRQQEVLAELGVLALKGTPFSDLLTKTGT